jgi:hypothetical protein
MMSYTANSNSNNSRAEMNSVVTGGAIPNTTPAATSGEAGATTPETQ